MYICTQRFATAAAMLAMVLISSYADAQLFGPRRQPVPVQAVPVQPAPVQAVPAQTNPRAQNNAVQAETNVQATAGSQEGEGRFIRGRNLIGMNIYGGDQQQLGTIQDFMIDNQAGGCPTIYFAMQPQIAGWNEGYVIVPFSAIQAGYDQRLRGDRFTLNLSTDALRRAPHLAVDRWNSGQDRKSFTDSQQFYQRTEHTVAKPETGGAREDRPQLAPNQQRPGEAAPAQNQQRREDSSHEQQQPRTGDQQNPQQGQQHLAPPEPRPAAERQPEAGRQPGTTERGLAPTTNREPEKKENDRR